jgi:hypothetical protein
MRHVNILFDTYNSKILNLILIDDVIYFIKKRNEQAVRDQSQDAHMVYIGSSIPEDKKPYVKSNFVDFS